MPEAYIRTVYWHEALHGQGATTTWVWERAQDGDFAENLLTRANCVGAFGRVALDLTRLAPEVHALSRATADMAILYPFAVPLLPSRAYVEEARAAFEGAYFTGAVCDFVTERQVEAGALSRYALVLVPRAAHAPEAVVQAFQAYIEGGGAVVTVGSCFTHNEYRRVRREGCWPSQAEAVWWCIPTRSPRPPTATSLTACSTMWGRSSPYGSRGPMRNRSGA